jgi:type IV pilus assembly protein PilW
VLPSAPGSVWKRVVGVKIAMLMRGQLTQRADAQNSVYDLFGTVYNKPADVGTQIDEASIPAAERSRTRKLFTATIVLRNDSAVGTVVALP